MSDDKNGRVLSLLEALTMCGHLYVVDIYACAKCRQRTRAEFDATIRAYERDKVTT